MSVDIDEQFRFNEVQCDVGDHWPSDLVSDFLSSSSLQWLLFERNYW